MGTCFHSGSINYLINSLANNGQIQLLVHGVDKCLFTRTFAIMDTCENTILRRIQDPFELQVLELIKKYHHLVLYAHKENVEN